MRYMNRGKYVTDSKESTTKIIESSYFFGIILILLFFMIIPVKSSDNNDKSEKAKYEENVSIAVKSLKKVCEPNEPVPVIIAIANHSSEPIYLFENEEDFLDGQCILKDSNGLRTIMSDPIPDPPPIPPGNYYIMKERKSTFVVPLYKINGKGIMIAVFTDALRIYHKHISEGIFHLDFDSIGIIHKIENPIIRKDVSHPLWVEPSSPMVKLRHKCGTIEIEIRKKQE